MNSIKKALFLSAIMVFSICAASNVSAESAGDKLAEGVGETATGWTEAPKEISETTEETNIVEGVTVGAVKGTAKAVEKTVKGVAKTATFMDTDN